MTSRSRSGRSRSTNSARDRFDLAPGLAHLNHGSYGAVPESVRREQERQRARIERNPTGFFQDEFPAAIRRMAGVVAARLGGSADDWVFCENATSAVNGVLGSLALAPGDEILSTSHAYGAVSKAMAAWAGRRGARLAIAPLPSRLESGDQAVEAVAAAIGPRTRLLVVDHITSATAAILPVERLASLARQAGVPLFVDGAHAPGQIPLDVAAIGADWYVGNAHKWLFAPRGCGVLWTSPARQAGTFPAVLSHGTDGGYRAAFDWIGTRDVTAWLCFEAAAQAHDRFGGKRLMARNCALAAEGAELLAEMTDAQVAAPAPMRAAMAALALREGCADLDLAERFRRDLSRDFGIVAPVYVFSGALCLRISAQIYNQIGDYRRCALACHRLLDAFGLA